jgi:hypothetical protein
VGQQKYTKFDLYLKRSEQILVIFPDPFCEDGVDGKNFADIDTRLAVRRNGKFLYA